jgi:hypothetical protein
MGSSKMAPCKVECHVETLCSSSRLATEEFEDTKRVTRIRILNKNRQQWRVLLAKFVVYVVLFTPASGMLFQNISFVLFPLAPTKF